MYVKLFVINNCHLWTSNYNIQINKLEIFQFGLINFSNENFIKFLSTFKNWPLEGIDNIHMVITNNSSNQDSNNLSFLYPFNICIPFVYYRIGLFEFCQTWVVHWRKWIHLTELLATDIWDNELCQFLCFITIFIIFAHVNQ